MVKTLVGDSDSFVSESRIASEVSAKSIAVYNSNGRC